MGGQEEGPKGWVRGKGPNYTTLRRCRWVVMLRHDVGRLFLSWRKHGCNPRRNRQLHGEIAAYSPDPTLSTTKASKNKWNIWAPLGGSERRLGHRHVGGRFVNPQAGDKPFQERILGWHAAQCVWSMTPFPANTMTCNMPFRADIFTPN
jgi:hypothetical protein